MNRNLPVRIAKDENTSRRSSRRKTVPVCAIALYDPRKLAKLRIAQALGHELSCTFNGFTLHISIKDH